jgi:hypothetical protein
MMLQPLFALSLLAVLPFWLLIIALPQWRGTLTLLRSPLVLLPLPILYVVLMVWHWPLLVRFVDHLAEHSPLAAVALFLGDPAGALISWLHLLAIDFFVGRWIYLDSQERGIPMAATTPILWATLLAGPLGMLLYLLTRSFVGSQPPREKLADT